MSNDPKVYLVRNSGQYVHWCPGCERLHRIGDTWLFNNNMVQPSFSPSVKHTYPGKDAGIKNEEGYQIPYACCHYYLTSGQLKFYPDSTHPMSGMTVDLPPIPFAHRMVVNFLK